MPNFLTLKKSNCKNCYKCIRHCPVKAIRFSGNQAHIIGNECILCGQCFVVCPQNAKEIVDETEKVKVLLNGPDPVIASVAPSFVANYDGLDFSVLRKALIDLGFSDAEETAKGAKIVKTEYERLVRDEKRDIVITSACHSINLLIQKYYPKALEYLADVISPMQAHCNDIKERIPNAKTVFIGPCVAKKDEADYYKGIVDAVLTYEELSRMLDEAGININVDYVDECEKTDKEGLTRLFPTPGGILRTLTDKDNGYTYMSFDGVNQCMSVLDEIESGRLHKCFIEMSACHGSCIGGPVMEKYHKSPVSDYVAVVKNAGNKDFDIVQPASGKLKKTFESIERKSAMPTEEEIKEILHQMGKFKPSQELNCGTCGYNTCKEKAIAIYQGKAEVSMCLPFLKDKAESFSDTIVKNTPNALLVLNERYEVQQINNSAKKLFNLRSEKDVLGGQVVRIIDPKDIMKCVNEGENINNELTYLAEYGRYVEQTIVHDKDSRVIICIFRDVTSEQKERTKKERITAETVEVADKVVDKQMRIVQEIASLLGETAAETKIALSKLKESITNE